MKKTKIVTVVGARPQFIKAAAVSRVIRSDFSDRVEEVLVHTGQHYDENMSGVFFEELDIPHPHHNLEISGGSHGAMTGRMLESVERVLQEESPDWLLVYGDTNSTLAGALAAAKLHIPVAHVEAGLRSFNMRMPEEVNRIVADRLSSLLFCPTETAVQNLKTEGLTTGVHQVGDVMYDVALFYRDIARARSTIQHTLGLQGRRFVLATCHRAENTDSPERLQEILKGLATVALDMPVVLPLHPRTRKIIEQRKLVHYLVGLTVLEPLSFLDMVALEQAAHVVFTDSGGVQKEAFFYGVPCVTIRDETEWIETVDLGWNALVGASTDAIVDAFTKATPPTTSTTARPYGNGKAAEAIVSVICGQSKP
jgi:UDP-GlcNAc3NAcA epimerase